MKGRELRLEDGLRGTFESCNLFLFASPKSYEKRDTLDVYALKLELVSCFLYLELWSLKLRLDVDVKC